MSGRPPFGLVAEAGLALLLASAAIRLVSFRTVAGWLKRPGGHTGDRRSRTLAAIRPAIEASSRRLPWRTACFEKGLAAHWMLQRRGLASTLHYGAATVAGELKAHVWVTCGDADVIGCENAADYALLASFPERPAGPHVRTRSHPPG